MKKIVYAVMLLFCMSIIGCQKDESNTDPKTEPDPEPGRVENVKLTRVIYEFAAGGHNVMDLEYDNKGRLTRMKGGMIADTNGEIKLVYNDQNNTVTVSFLDSSSETYQLNKEGLCENDGGWTYSYFNGHLVGSKGSLPYHTDTDYYWENDCLVDIVNTYSGQSSHHEITCTSFDNPFFSQSFDPWVMSSPSFFTGPCYLGFCGLSSKKLIKTFNSQSFEYSFNESGRLKEVLIREGGEVWIHTYYNYEDEPLLEPRDERIEPIPSSLRGEWIITNTVENDNEGFDPYGVSISNGDDIVHCIYVYEFGENSISQYLLEVDSETIRFNNGVLSGVKKKYESFRDGEIGVYKNNHLIYVYFGEFIDRGPISIINDNMFYAIPINSTAPASWIKNHVYEKLTEIQYIQ